MSGPSRLVARMIKATTAIDWAYRRFDRMRALLVTAYASDEALAAYNDLTYGAAPVYDAHASQFRERLFNWEEDFVARVFPAAPSRVLVGGAGGGREAFQLAGRGYDVTAFEPSPHLARSMADRARASGAAVSALLGRYESLPVLQDIGNGERIDLTLTRPFDASMLGWSSFSHIRDTRTRIAALRRFAALTDGPVVVSFFSTPPAKPAAPSSLRRVMNRLGRRSDGDAFTVHIGFYHLSSPGEVAREVAAAGLQIVMESYDDSDGHWPWVAVARPQIAARLAATSRD
ncbi:MAG: class I SAM-dependent methyltransferase [Acidobacteria bacterium]|nr:class I SAM-dependent methyltransferase [Acidobacteriota bacterium]